MACYLIDTIINGYDINDLSSIFVCRVLNLAILNSREQNVQESVV